MTYSLNETLVLQQNLLHYPVFWVTPLLALFSFLTSIFLTLRKAPFSLQRWRGDEYFRVKFLLCVSLVSNRFLELLDYAVSLSPYTSDLTWGEPVYDAARAVNPMANITTWFVLYFIFLLTIQRYMRMEMIAAGSKRFTFCMWYKRIFTFTFIFIIM